MSDPYQEPENSTVDDWFGQSVERDAELADELAAATGSERVAAERFDAEATGAGVQQRRHEGGNRGAGPADQAASDGQTRADRQGKPQPTADQAQENDELESPA